MNRISTPVLTLVFACMFAGSAQGYELVTHRKIGEQSFDASVLAPSLNPYDPEYLAQLGIAPPNDEFEVGRAKAMDATSDGTARSWLRQGAMDEDDSISLQPFRVRNHFFNPLTNSGLKIGKSASYWGIEFGKDISGQDYSFKDARGYFYAALTTPQPTGPTGREHYWAQAFYALGHVIHLIQDMAQPQHTRNDTHLLAWAASTFAPAHAALAFYEQYTDARAKSATGLSYAGYDPVYRDADTSTFTLPLDFWHRVGGMGLAAR
jgi:hypothetical protein